MTVAEIDVIDKLLEHLSDGQCHSGEDLGAALGVSRSAVWKHLKKISNLGLELHSQPGKGYQLLGGLELLNSEEIKRNLKQSTDQYFKTLHIVHTINSTNSFLMAHASKQLSGSVCMAEQQTDGRGRRGRSWVSPFAKNIYQSVLWHFEGGASELEGLSLAVGVAISRALEQFGISGVQLKWPNDVLVGGRKLAGVLLEMGGDPSGSCHVVVGVGINVAMPGSLAKSIDQPWVDVATLVSEQKLAPISRNQLAAALMSEVLLLMATYADTGFSYWRESWVELGLYIGSAVKISTSTSEQSGIMLGVTTAGALRVDIEGSEQLFYGGEVSMRSMA